MVEGCHFTLFTDHLPLVAAISRVRPPRTAKQQRQLAFIAEFTTDLVHLPGEQNVVADTHSCIQDDPLVLAAAATGSPVVSYDALAAAQTSCPDLAAMRANPSLTPSSLAVGDKTLHGNMSTCTFQPSSPRPSGGKYLTPSLG